MSLMKYVDGESKPFSVIQENPNRVMGDQGVLLKTSVGTVMTKNIRTVNSNTELMTAWKLMNEMGVHHFPVLDNEKLVGILSDRDFARIGDQMNSFAVKDVMSKTVVFGQEDTMLNEVITAMVELNISSMPIMNTENKLTGLVTDTDILKCLVRN